MPDNKLIELEEKNMDKVTQKTKEIADSVKKITELESSMIILKKEKEELLNTNSSRVMELENLLFFHHPNLRICMLGH